MRPYTLKIENGKLLDAFVGQNANYIRLDNASAPITFVDPDKNQRVTLESGEDVILNEFKRLHVEHDEATTQTIEIYIGRDTKKGSSQVTGNMQIIGGADNLANPPEIIAQPKTLATFHGGNFTAALDTIVTPAANINGVRIDTITAKGLVVPNGEGNIIIKTSAPVSSLDGFSIFVLYQYISGFIYSQKNNFPIIIPAGYGLYAMANAACGKYDITYEIL